MKRLLVLLIALMLLAGCGSQTLVGPSAHESQGSQIHSVGDADGGALVPPTKAENHLAPEPDDVELGPRG